MRWLYWVMFDVEIMSDEQLQKVKRVISPWILACFTAALVAIVGWFIAVGKDNWYPVALALGVVVIFILFDRQANVQALSNHNPSRYLPAESKQFKWVKRGVYVAETMTFFYIIEKFKVGPQRTLWLGGLAILIVAWSWYQWRRLNRRLHIQK